MTGILRGFDPYMNIVLDDAVEECSSTVKHRLGMVVSGWVGGREEGSVMVVSGWVGGREEGSGHGGEWVGGREEGSGQGGEWVGGREELCLCLHVPCLSSPPLAPCRLSEETALFSWKLWRELYDLLLASSSLTTEHALSELRTSHVVF